MSKLYSKLPSELMYLEDEYTAHCFDSALGYIMTRLDKGDQIHFRKQYTSFSDIYKEFEN